MDILLDYLFVRCEGRKARRAMKKRRGSKRKAKGKKRSRRRIFFMPLNYDCYRCENVFLFAVEGRKKKASSAAQ